jgi:hypothetical protein
VIRRHGTGVLLAVAAPLDQLYTATEVNEWALCASLLDVDAVRWPVSSRPSSMPRGVRPTDAFRGPDSSASTGDAPIAVSFAAAALPVLDDALALERFARLAAIEAHPKLRSLIDAIDDHGLSFVLDDDDVDRRHGFGARELAVRELPDPRDVSWSQLHDVPVAVVTGSNGKTTTVRLLAASAREQGWRDGYSCTDGLFIAGEQRSRAVTTRGGRHADRTAGRSASKWRFSRLRAAASCAAGLRCIGPRRGRDQRQRGSLRRVRHSRSRRTGRRQARRRERRSRRWVAGAECRRCVVARSAAFASNARLVGSRFDHDHAVLREHRERGGWTSGVRAGRLIVSRGVERTAEAASRGRVDAAQEIDLGDIAAMR